ncbi:PAS domain S-box protein [Caldimonas sp. KR1-144]|uniref:PAS domain-containing sensor histidine kinase n=1 Tax=Caldimonas sp. KR1-144 TaxID=3400911 RepID=UPI003C0C1453
MSAVLAHRNPAPFAAASPAWRDRLSLLLESTGDGVFGIDLAGCATFVNRAAAQMLGHEVDAVIGRNMHALIHHTHAGGAHYPEADCPIFNAFRRGLPCRIDDEVLWRADGSAFAAEYSSYPVIEAGVVVGAVVTIKDITDRKRAEEALLGAKRELERSNDALEQRVAARTVQLSRALDQLRELAAHLETVRESERTRIAREIHDELGSLLVALKMDVGWLGKRLDDRPELHCKCQGMGRMIDAAVDNVGRIITDLRPSILDHQGLWAALEWQAQEFVEATELEADLHVHVAAGVAAPDGGLSIAVFRIFQEMLSNVARHARARHVAIRIVVDDPPEPMLYIDVRDDGIGAAADALAAPRSYGVLGMRERAAHFGGRLSIDSAPGAGTRVRLAMPLPHGEGAR